MTREPSDLPTPGRSGNAVLSRIIATQQVRIRERISIPQKAETTPDEAYGEEEISVLCNQGSETQCA